MTALPRILGVDDLPLAELAAARLDGELFRVARGWAPADVPGTPVDRALAAAVGLPPAWVAELGTAAWIWGARDQAPDPVRFSATPEGRAAGRPPGVIVRETVLRSGDWTTVGGVRVTTPERTVIDLLRVDDPSDDAAALWRLLDPSPGEADRILRRLRRLPHGALAATRLGSARPPAVSRR